VSIPERISEHEALGRLAVAEDTLRAIGAGEVDAFVISDGNGGRRVFSLSNSDRPYRMFVENMNDGAATLTQNGLILYANRRLAELLSSSRERITGSPLNAFLADDDPGALERLRVVANQGATVEVNLRDTTGTSIPVLVGVSPLEVGKSRLSCLTFTDLRAQKALEEQLRQAQKIEAIGKLAGGIAHDFNNILTVIRGYSDILIRNPSGAGSADAVARIDRAAARAAELTAQLLAFSRQQVMRPEVSDVNVVVEETLTLLERLLGDDIVLEKSLDPNLAPVLVDRSSLAQVMLNLAVNGRSAMAGGGSLAIRTESRELDEVAAAAHGGLAAGPYVLIEVADTGTGMSEATRTRAFDPFFTTKEDGTGLGLSTVYGIVRQSGGHVGVASELGVGTTFTIFLPASAAPLPMPLDPVEVASYEGTEAILVVEDNEPLRELNTVILESYGYTVLAAAGGPQALALAASLPPGAIQLLLTDVVMPMMNGREVADALRADRPDLRVLYTSGYPADTAVRGEISAARTAFIQKPYLAEDLARTIREVFANEI
jgi:two-component system cell cycle sensor histidine kinase/response regulator CckA